MFQPVHHHHVPSSLLSMLHALTIKPSTTSVSHHYRLLAIAIFAASRTTSPNCLARPRPLASKTSVGSRTELDLRASCILVASSSELPIRKKSTPSSLISRFTSMSLTNSGTPKPTASHTAPPPVPPSNSVGCTTATAPLIKAIWSAFG